MKKFIFSFYLIFAAVGSLKAHEAAVASPFEPLLLDSILSTSPDARPQIESQVFHLINQYRQSQSLPPLRWSSVCAHQARKHSLNMAHGVVPFGHDGFIDRFNLIRMAIPSLSLMGENVALNRGFSNPGQKAVDSWLASPGHLDNIVGDYNLSGVGVAVNSKGEYYFTQIFVKANPTVEGADDEALSFESFVYSPPAQLEAK